MTPHGDWFLNFRNLSGGKVLLGNNQECKIMGIGDIKIKIHDGTTRTLSTIRYVLGLKRNLISLGELDKNGYSYRGVGGVLKVIRGSLICMKVILQNGIYLLQASTLCGEAAVGENKSYEHARLWHYRMAHISEQGLKELSRQWILGAGSVTALDQCEESEIP